MACFCPNFWCPEHPKCPYCNNYSTVFASGGKEFTCTRCKKVFTKKTVVGSCTTLDHIYPAPSSPSQKVRRCYCGKRSLKVNRNLDMPFYTAEKVETPMAKKNIKLASSKKSSKSSKTERAPRTSNVNYKWVKPLSDEPNPETTYGTIYQTMRKVKSGSLADITAAAVKNGLTKFSDQDPTRMVRVHLRFMVNGGSVAQTRNGEAVPAKKAAKKTSGKKVFKLKK